MEVVMDLLLTVLGNALAQDDFRETLFEGDPVAAAEAWGFRLTKGDGEFLTQIFTGDEAYIAELKERFDNLYDQLYLNIASPTVCGKPCKFTVSPPVHPPKPLTKVA
jgi:hypothetical protein